MKIVTPDQYTDAWWAARRGVPTASEAGNILTHVNWKPGKAQETYIEQLIADLHDPGYPPLNNYQTPAMKNGSQREKEARDALALALDTDIQQAGFCTSDDGRFGCSPDGLIGDDAGVEIKSPSAKIQTRRLLAGVVPPDALPQIHFSLVVTGRKLWHFMSYCPGLPDLIQAVPWSEKTDQMAQAMEDFWVKYQEKLALIRALIRALDADPGPGPIDEQAASDAFF